MSAHYRSEAEKASMTIVVPRHGTLTYFPELVGYTPEQHAERVVLERVLIRDAMRFDYGECEFGVLLSAIRALRAFEDKYGRPA